MLEDVVMKEQSRRKERKGEEIEHRSEVVAVERSQLHRDKTEQEVDLLLRIISVAHWWEFAMSNMRNSSLYFITAITEGKRLVTIRKLHTQCRVKTTRQILQSI
jgi:hypothetical protein